MFYLLAPLDQVRSNKLVGWGVAFNRQTNALIAYPRQDVTSKDTCSGSSSTVFHVGCDALHTSRLRRRGCGDSD